MKNLKRLNVTTVMALSLLLTTGVSSLNNTNTGVGTSYASEQKVYKQVKTKKGNLNVRKSPNTSSGVIGKFTSGSTVLTYGASSDNKWLKVYVNNQYGWAHSDFLIDAQAPASGITVSNDHGGVDITDRKVKVIVNKLNARKGPGLSFGINGSYTKGKELTITHSKNADNYTWYRVANTTNWIAGKHTEDIVGSTGGQSTGTTGGQSEGGNKPTPPKPEQETGTNKNGRKITDHKKNQDIRVVVNGKILSQAERDLTKPSTFTMKLASNTVYQVTEQAKIDGELYYLVHANNSNTKGWFKVMSTKKSYNFKHVTSDTKVTIGSKPVLKQSAKLYKEIELKRRTNGNHIVYSGHPVEIRKISKGRMNITHHAHGNPSNRCEYKKGESRSGWTERSALTKKYELENGNNEQILEEENIDMNNLKITDLFKNVITNNSDNNEFSTFSSMNETTEHSDEYTKITGVPGKPYLAKLNINMDSNEGDEAFYVDQYLIDITTKDNEIITVRFDPSNYDIIADALTGSEVTFIVETTLEEDGEIIPLYVVDTIIEKNNVHFGITPEDENKEQEIVLAMANDYTNYLSTYGINVKPFTDEDIKIIADNIKYNTASEEKNNEIENQTETKSEFEKIKD